MSKDTEDFLALASVIGIVTLCATFVCWVIF
jgi:hypothetical protein